MEIRIRVRTIIITLVLLLAAFAAGSASAQSGGPEDIPVAFRLLTESGEVYRVGWVLEWEGDKLLLIQNPDDTLQVEPFGCCQCQQECRTFEDGSDTCGGCLPGAPCDDTQAITTTFAAATQEPTDKPGVNGNPNPTEEPTRSETREPRPTEPRPTEPRPRPTDPAPVCTPKPPPPPCYVCMDQDNPNGRNPNE